MLYPRLLALFFGVALSAFAADRPNLLIITVDDMSADSLGIFGAELADHRPACPGRHAF